MIYISATQWMLDPGFGPVVLAVFAAAIAYGVTAVHGRHPQPQGALQRA